MSIGELPETLRAVFLLRDVEGLSTAETAEALGITAGAAKVRLHRARLELRGRLARFSPSVAQEGVEGGHDM